MHSSDCSEVSKTVWEGQIEMNAESSRLFNSFIGAAATSAAFETKLLDELEQNHSVYIADFCAREKLHQASLEAIVFALASFRIVTWDDSYKHVARGALFDDIYREKGYFLWLVRGYGYLWQNIADLVKSENRPADGTAFVDKHFEEVLSSMRRERTFVHRSGAHIAAGGADYGVVFVDHHFDNVLCSMPFNCVADLGCGSARRLIGLAKKYPQMRGLGIDIDSDAVRHANESIGTAGLQQRISVRQADVGNLETSDEFSNVDVLSCFFMGHDLWPKANCLRVLTRLREVFPNAGRFLLCDTYRSDAKPSAEIPTFTLGFEFTHAIMGQAIPNVAEWEALFREAKWKLAQTIPIEIPFSVIFDLRRE